MKRFFLLLALLMAITMPALADETLPAEDDLSATPMGCLLPSLSPVSTGGSPVEAVTSGANGVNGYVGDWGIYLSCMGNKLLRTINDYAQAAADKTAAVIRAMQKPKPAEQPSNNL